MISEEMYELGSKSSIIREIFEFGKKRKAEIGAEKVFDFSLGNPTVSAPEKVKDTIIELLNDESIQVHGYTSAQGNINTRTAIANDLNSRFGTNFSFENFYMTAGAAASLTISIKAICNKGDEFIVFAPYFPEYKCFVESSGGKFTIISADYEKFQINFEEFEKKLNPNVKGVIINSPNNPSGVVYSEDTIKKLASILKLKSEEYAHPIVLISDEPYREIVYDDLKIPFVTKYYKNTIVCYSYSKSLSLPGERIGYVLVPSEIEDFKKVYAAICGAGRALGFVCAPSLFQLVIEKCAGLTSDISIYEKNRNLLYNSLNRIGYDCVKPQGAFYLFLKAPNNNAIEFAERAKALNLLLTPANDFGCPEYLRVAYCVDEKTIRNSIVIFELLNVK